MIQVKEITTKKGIKQFVTFPFSLYKNNKYWVPPIIKEEINNFNKVKNPVFEHADARYFLAYKNGKIAGRIAAIINSYEVEKQGIKKMRFGWFDVIDDEAVTQALIEKVTEIGRNNNLTFIEGPLGFTNLDKTGILIDGFNHIGTMVTWYNHPYYQTHLTKLGFKKEKTYIESTFKFKNVNGTYFNRISKIIEKRYNLSGLSFTKTKDILPYVDEMFNVFSASYSKLTTFVPISQYQIDFFKKKYIGFINPEYIKFVTDKNGSLIAFAIVMPSFSKALQKIKGKLFPFGFLHLLRAKKKSKNVIFYLIGVHPDYQNKGVHAIIFNEFYKTFSTFGIENCIRTPELEDNLAIQKLWKDFNPKIYKRRQTYRLNL